MDGLTITTGREPKSTCNKYSAIALVYVYVFGRFPTILGVSIFKVSPSIHLEKFKKKCLWGFRPNTFFAQCNNPKLELVNINADTKFGKILSILILCQKENLISIKGHNSLTNMRNMTGNNRIQDLANINAHTKFGEILSICSQDNEQK